MKKLIIKFHSSYRKKGSGNLVFRYAVTGSEADMAAYKAAQGEFHRVNPDGTVLWFTSNHCGASGTLLLNTETGKCFADMSAYDQAASICEQYGGNFGQALAEQMVQKLMGTAPAAAPVAVAQPSEELEKQ